MKVKTSELSGAQLDWAVAKAEDKQVKFECGLLFLITPNITYGDLYRPSEDWEHGGPIIEREKISLDQCYDTHLLALSSDCRTYSLGATPLIAAMRCYVFSKLGEEVEVPDGLA
jgi:hypothetical protein